MRNKTIAFVVFIVSSYLAAATAVKGEYDDVAKKVEAKILKENKVKIDGLKVFHQGDTIYLEGVAEVFGSRYIAGHIASKEKGIKKVENQIAVKSSEANDVALQAQLVSQAEKYLQRGPFDALGVRVNHGFVTLYGSVRDPSIRERVFNDIIWTAGVRDVENKIVYASISPQDDRLRLAIYQRLSQEFPQYFTGRIPSIIILVDHGRVTLLGHVSSQATRQVIASRIRSLVGVLSVSNQLDSE